LISSPAVLDQWIKTAAEMRWKYRYMVTRFSGSYQQDGADALLLNLKKTVKKIEKLFRDYTRSEFIPVCIPEAMSEAETGRLIASLGDFGITVKQLIINNVMEPAGDCLFCMERKRGQEKYLARIEKTYPEMNKVQVPLFAHEVCGLDRLNEVSRYLFTPEKDKHYFKSESDRIAGKD
jgi:arsenite/tail-anchored protein-transporting ATPase